MAADTEQGKEVYIGLGSNIEQPYIQIKNAILALNKLPDTNVVADSGYYKSRPMGPDDQPDFINAVVELRTRLSENELLEQCQTIEQQQGRIKKRHWGERTIDLDILLYEDIEMKTDKLEIPHPGICQRDFVYLPLLKLNSEITIPGLGVLKNIVSLQKEQSLEQSLEQSPGNANVDADIEFDCRYVGNIE